MHRQAGDRVIQAGERALLRLFGLVLVAALLLSLLDFRSQLTIVRLALVPVAALAWLLWRRTSAPAAVLSGGAVRAARLVAILRPWHIVAAALVLRLLWVAAARVQPVSDFLTYHGMAVGIAGGSFYFDPVYPNGASYLLAPFYRLLGDGPLNGQVVLAGLGAVQCALLMGLARTLFPERPLVAPLAGLLYALSPIQIIFASLIGTDIPFSLLVMTSVLGMARWYRSGYHWGWAAAAAAAVGCAQYVRGEAALFLVCAGLLVLVATVRSPRLPVAEAALTLVVMAAVFVAVCLPFVVYWYERDGKLSLSPAPYQSGMVLLTGGMPGLVQNDEALDRLFDDIAARAGLAPKGTPDYQNATWWRGFDEEALAMWRSQLRADPLRQARIAVTDNLPQLWGREASIRAAISTGSRIPPAVARLIYLGADLVRLAVVLLTVWALLFRSRALASPPLVWVFVSAALAKTLIHLVAQSQPRYAFAFAPLLLLLAAVTLSEWLGTGKRR